MSHDTQVKDSGALTPKEQSALAKLLQHKDIAKLIKEVEDKNEK